MGRPEDRAVPVTLVYPEPADPLGEALREAQFVLLKHPVAAQALFRAFVEEGRRFALTADGAAWQERLAGSELIRRGRVVWEAGTLNLLEDRPETVLPTRLLDALLQAVASDGLEPLLSALFERNFQDEPAAPPVPR